MYIADIALIENTTIKLTDTIQFALERMEDYQFNLLPVVDVDDYLGYVHLQDLLNALDDQLPISSVHLRTDPIYLTSAQHPYDAIRTMSAYRVEQLPILDDHQKFEAILTAENLIIALADLQSHNEIGAIIVLEVGTHDYALSKIAHIAEVENCQILNCAVKAVPENSSLEITLKVNQLNISGLLSSFSRQNYQIKATYNSMQETDDLADRYQHLMNYINT